jgi:pimeloyl-ACP methyl ester carboxylesterase
MNTHDLDGYPRVLVASGHGEPLLLVHGSLNDCRAWMHQMAPFGAWFRTLAPGLQHCHPERQDGRGGDFTIEQQAPRHLEMTDAEWRDACALRADAPGAGRGSRRATAGDRARRRACDEPRQSGGVQPDQGGFLTARRDS